MNNKLTPSRSPRIHSLLPLVALVTLSLAAAPVTADSLLRSNSDSHSTHQQYIVRFHPEAAEASLPRLRAAALQRAAQHLPAARVRGLQVQQVRQMASGSFVVRTSHALDSIESEAFIAALTADPAVVHAQPDLVLQSTWIPNDQHYPKQWGLGTWSYAINVQPAWELSRGAGITVAVLDSGTTVHPDLDAQMLPGYDFVSDPQVARDGNGRDANPQDEGNWGTTIDCRRNIDSDWHGTKVAGTLAAIANNREGIAGVANGARILPVRVTGRCSRGMLSDTVDAMLWAAGFDVTGVKKNTNPANIVNISLAGIGMCSSEMQEAIDKLGLARVTVVTGVGNDNADAKDYTPANCLRIIAVGSNDGQGRKSLFSNTGENVDLVAPGEDIYSTSNGGSTYPETPWYGEQSGTSFAAPHVAGVVALMQSGRQRLLTPANVELILKNTAKDMGADCPRSECGFGLIDAEAAVRRARATP